VLSEARNWGAAKRKALDTAFHSLTIVSINHPSVIDADVQLDLHGRGHPQGARHMGKNELLTTDKDLAFLIPNPVQGHVIANA
jgi:hypothetical protein